MPSASWIHMSRYSASFWAIAPVFWPRKLLATRVVNSARLAVITGGGTIDAYAVWYAPAAALAWVPVWAASAAALCIHAMYGAAAEAIRADDGPSHVPVVRLVIAVWYWVAVASKSAASPSHAVAASNNGPDPAPWYISAELTSGGISEWLIDALPDYGCCRVGRLGQLVGPGTGTQCGHQLLVHRRGLGGDLLVGRAVLAELSGRHRRHEVRSSRGQARRRRGRRRVARRHRVTDAGQRARSPLQHVWLCSYEHLQTLSQDPA